MIYPEQPHHHHQQQRVYNEYTHVKIVNLADHNNLLKKQNYQCQWSEKPLTTDNSVVLDCNVCIDTNALLFYSFNIQTPGRFHCLSCRQIIKDKDEENHEPIPIIRPPQHIEFELIIALCTLCAISLLINSYTHLMFSSAKVDESTLTVNNTNDLI